ncbi:hypothetical protein IU433_14805 [Nocardia puris]|uniref:hypothetical protein n=1 Tax=Nocardia puris TaxID=208602 RepID=UPI0018940516|nr:hypothetical protein [Nocardia puris]MBF6216054.1 hypothetical protein [Nocardia puris]MBF6366048.1 hypothetical protein [Nocardia puris]MBF6460309.1 hypothetical protein [Nocardia puris]
MTDIRKSSSNPHHRIVRKPGQKPYVAGFCVQCEELTKLDLLRDGVCFRCARTKAA